MTRLAIIADDLTGALDASAPFAARGLSTIVALSASALPEALASGAEIVGISTDSREIEPEAARDAVAAVASQLPRETRIFKKVDSRLKGNITAELDALPHSRSLVVPAIPSFGRWVQNGKLGGFGVSEPMDVRVRLGTHASNADIPDAVEQRDIDHAVRSRQHDLLIGARGLAEALAGLWSTKGDAPTPSQQIERAVVVIGSTDPITLEQVTALRSATPSMHYQAAPNGIAPAPHACGSRLTLIQATPGPNSVDPAIVAAHLAESLQQLDLGPGTLLVLSGGATAQAVLQHLGFSCLTLLGEALPGLPIARVGRFTIITKSGGFGDKDTLVRLLDSIGVAERE